MPSHLKSKLIRTVVSKCFGGEDLSEGHSIGVLNLLPHVYQHHTLGVDQPEACECIKVISKSFQVTRGY